MRRPFVAAVVAAVMLGAALAGCARGDEPRTPTRTIEPQITASSPSPASPADDSVACRLLTSKERRSIAGVRLDAISPIGDVPGNTQRCRWVKKLTSPGTSLLVATSSAQTFAEGIPVYIDELIRTGRVKRSVLGRLSAARKNAALDGKLGDQEACRLFSLVVEASGGVKNSKVNVFTLGAAATAHTCTKGVYTAVTYVEPNELPPSAALASAMTRVLGYAHKRAIKLSSE